MIDTSLFPHKNFLVRIDIKEENRICWFKDDIDLKKYLTRYKIDEKKATITHSNEKSTEPSKDDSPKVRQRTGKSSNRSSSSTRKRTKSVDKSRNTNKTPKSK